MTIDKIKENKNHNQMMLDLTFLLGYVKFDDVKECTNVKKIRDKLEKN